MIVGVELGIIFGVVFDERDGGPGGEGLIMVTGDLVGTLAVGVALTNATGDPDAVTLGVVLQMQHASFMKIVPLCKRLQ